MYPYNRIHTDCVYKFMKIARNLLLGVLSSDINKSVSVFKYYRECYYIGSGTMVWNGHGNNK